MKWSGRRSRNPRVCACRLRAPSLGISSSLHLPWAHHRCSPPITMRVGVAWRISWRARCSWGRLTRLFRAVTSQLTRISTHNWHSWFPFRWCPMIKNLSIRTYSSTNKLKIRKSSNSAKTATNYTWTLSVQHLSIFPCRTVLKSLEKQCKPQKRSRNQRRPKEKNSKSALRMSVDGGKLIWQLLKKSKS